VRLNCERTAKSTVPAQTTSRPMYTANPAQI
jgi:hypothetical protein